MKNNVNNILDVVFRLLTAQGRDPASVTLEEAKQLTLAVLRRSRRREAVTAGESAADLASSDRDAGRLYSVTTR